MRAALGQLVNLTAIMGGVVDDPELAHLACVDEDSLLMQIALADNAQLALYAPDDLIEYGCAVVQRLLPRARALICRTARCLTLLSSRCSRQLPRTSLPTLRAHSLSR
jgi:hypothetical protein